MERVGPGSILAGRYHVQDRIRQATWSSTWHAVDETLERPVSVLVVDRGHPRGSDVVDAARRAAGVEDPRLQRVLDVGVEDGLTYVVSEWVGADQLSDLLRSGPLPPDEVRRLVGEAATALEAARHRGLHHLALTPDSLLRGHDGPVTITGLAVDAALAGIEETDAAEASRQDARALVALIYAGLTGRWPLNPVPGMEPPPRVGSALPAPSELTAGVPADLDTVCVETLRDRHGPADPGQLATQLAPWPAGPVVGPRRAPGSFPVFLGGDAGPATTVMPAVGAPSVQASVKATTPETPPPPPPPRPPSTHVPPHPSEPAPDEAPEPAAPRLSQGAQDPATSPPGFAPPMLPPTESSTWPPIAAVFPPAMAADLEAGQPEPYQPTADPAAEAGAGFGPETAVAAPSSYRPPAAEESPAPLLPPTPTARPPAAQIRAVLGVVLGFVLVLCLLAYCGLRSFGSHDDSSGGATGPSGGSPTTAASSKPSASATPSTSASTQTTPATTGAVKIKAATGFDPEGDGSEDDSLARLAYDKKSATGWTSDTYRSLTWGGLKKGVGIRFDLGSPQTVHSATVTIGGTGATVQLRAVDGTSLSGSTVLAKKANADGTITLDVDSPVSSRYYVIWFTKPGQVSGGYRAEVNDVTFR